MPFLAVKILSNRQVSERRRVQTSSCEDPKPNRQNGHCRMPSNETCKHACMTLGTQVCISALNSCQRLCRPGRSLKAVPDGKRGEAVCGHKGQGKACMHSMCTCQGHDEACSSCCSHGCCCLRLGSWDHERQPSANSARRLDPLPGADELNQALIAW